MTSEDTEETHSPAGDRRHHHSLKLCLQRAVQGFSRREEGQQITPAGRRDGHPPRLSASFAGAGSVLSYQGSWRIICGYQILRSQLPPSKLRVSSFLGLCVLNLIPLFGWTPCNLILITQSNNSPVSTEVRVHPQGSRTLQSERSLLDLQRPVEARLV